MTDVFIYGEIGPDNIIQIPWLPDPERAAPVTSDSYHIGGAASNVAVLLASWGIEVGLGGNALGTDIYGTMMLEFLKQQNHLDISALAIFKDAHTPFCRIIIPPTGDRIVLYYNSETAIQIDLLTEQVRGCRLFVTDNNGFSERYRAVVTAHKLAIPVFVGDIYTERDPILDYADWIINSANLIRSKLPGIDVWDYIQSLQKKKKSYFYHIRRICTCAGLWAGWVAFFCSAKEYFTS